MKKRSFRSTFVSVILVITVAISIVNLAVYGINIKKIRQVEVLKMKTAGERIDDMITISLNNIKGLKQICCTDNYARNILLKNNEKNDIGTKFENQNYMDNALKHIASMDTLILRATIVNKYGNIYCTDMINSFQAFDQIYVMTKGGPGTATQVVSYLIYMNAFQYFKQGYASAMAYILFIIVFIASIVQLRFSEKNSI